MNAVLRRIHNPKGRACGCDSDCWCRRTALGRAVKWWFPARFVGIHHKYGGPSDGDRAEWKRQQQEHRGD